MPTPTDLLHTAISRLVSAGHLVSHQTKSEQVSAPNTNMAVKAVCTVVLNGQVFYAETVQDNGPKRRRNARRQVAHQVYQQMLQAGVVPKKKKGKTIKPPQAKKKLKIQTAYVHLNRYFQLLENTGVTVSRTPTRMVSKGDGTCGSTTAYMSVTVNGKRYRAQATISDGGKRQQRARILAVTRLRNHVIADHGDLS